MFPHERSLVSKMKNRPFVLLGVNTDSSPEEVTQKNKQQKITWRSWFDGRGGPICKQYAIKGFPTLMILDHKGVIRKKMIGSPRNPNQDIDAFVTKLLRDAEKASGTASADEKPAGDKPAASGDKPATSGDDNKPTAALGLDVGKRAPEISGKDLDGKTFKLSDYRGKVVVLDFWAHW